MNFKIIECEQRSDAWKQARLGRLTGSKASFMMARVKNGEAAGRRNLRMDLALERVTGQCQERQFTTLDLQHGQLTEAQALSAYEAQMGAIVERTGFICGGPIMVGCSLDGHMEDFRGILECKCPKEATHFEYLRTRKIPTDYRWQCIHNLWVTGAQWCDFVSFSPFFPEKLQYLCVRLERDEAEIAQYEKDAMTFLAEVNLEVQTVLGMAA